MSDAEVMEAYIAEAVVRRIQAWATLCAIVSCRTSELRTTPVDTGSGVRLIVHGATWPKGANLNEVLNGTLPPVEIVATGDGRSLDPTRWHDGDPTGEWVYAERWSPAGLLFHGWIDPTSRQLLQVG